MKDLKWIGTSRKDLKEFPDEIIDEMGHALHLAQMSERHKHATTFSGCGSANIVEIKESDRSGTYRVVYTVEMDDIIFVLHSFQKKSKSGKETPKQEIELIKRRLKDAKSLYKQLKEEKKL